MSPPSARDARMTSAAPRPRSPADVDLTDHNAFAAAVPYAGFDLLRREAPVHWHPEPGGPGFWAVTRYDDVVAVSRDTATFSSETGASALEDLAPDALEARKSMIDMDPPGHTRLRRIVTPAFTRRAVAAYEPRLRELTRVVIDRAVEVGEFDAVTAVAAAVPIQILCELLGVPAEDQDTMIELADRMIANTDPDFTDVLLDGADSERYRLLPFRSPAALDMFAHSRRLTTERRAAPRADLMSRIVGAEVDGRRLSQREIDAMFLLLVVAGNETTRQAIALGLLALLERPEQLDRLRAADPTEAAVAVEEVLRWSTPLHHFRRTATCDVELRGQRIRAGDKVVIWYTSANRDEEVFADPYRFDIRRQPNNHLAFGRGGPHRCLGEHLARLEIRVVFEELLARVDQIESTGPAVRIRSNFTNGMKRLPVRVCPRH